MTPDQKVLLTKELVRDESLRLKPYLDCCGKAWFNCTCVEKGKLTIGVGRNLDDVGITQEEAKHLLEGDIRTAENCLNAAYPWTQSLGDTRRRVLVNMMFNMGLPVFSQFKRTLAHVQAGRWEEAAVEMLSSDWSQHVGDRALRLAEMMRTGKDL